MQKLTDLDLFLKKYQSIFSVIIVGALSRWWIMPQFGEAAGCLVSGPLFVLMGVSLIKKLEKALGWTLLFIGLLFLTLGLMLQFHLYPT
jgi:hypothetical protein